jgi:protein TonB
MERVASWYSLDSPIGSMLSSIFVHGALVGAFVLSVTLGFMKQRPPEGEVQIDYQVLDEPPPPTPVVHHIRRVVAPETPAPQPVHQDIAPKELQDEKSTIAGTQTAQKPVATAASSTQGDADATPYYKIKPKYPRAALVAGVEGWILLKIDVKDNGEVENVRIIGGEQRNMFESEARRAVEKWKYRPGKLTDHQVRVDFKLADAS